MLKAEPAETTANTPRWGVLAVAYVALILYGSLYPFSGWVTGRPPMAFIVQPWDELRLSLGDIVTNAVAYVPLGILGYRYLLSTSVAARAAVLALAMVAGLSFAVEFLQGFLPARTQSAVDLLLNTLGGAVGVAIGRIPHARGKLAGTLRQLRSEWILPGRNADLAQLALVAWILTQTLPLVPSLDVGKFRSSLAPLLRATSDPASINAWHTLSEALSYMGIGLLTVSIVRPNKPALAAYGVLTLSLMLAQVPIVNRQLLPETLIGAALGLVALGAVRWLGSEGRASWAFFLLFSSFCIAAGLGSPSSQVAQFNWIPFGGSLDNTIGGIRFLLETGGLALALVWSVRTVVHPSGSSVVAWLAGFLAVGGALVLELGQLRIAGRAGDVTTPLVLAVMWLVAWQYAKGAPEQRTMVPGPVAFNQDRPYDPHRPRDVPRRVRPAWRWDVTMVAAIGIAVWIGAKLPFLPYNVRELIYAGHPVRSALLLSLALYLTLGVPCWLVAASRTRPPVMALLPAAIAVNALLAWVAVANAVPGESVHDIVGSPILHWPGQLETCLRFVALHAAVTLLVTGAVLAALLAFDLQHSSMFAWWMVVVAALAPLLHWVIVVEAATDNLTELMRGGGTPLSTATLALAGVSAFLPGCLLAACAAFARRSIVAAVVAVIAAGGAYLLLLAGTESAIHKYGHQFSALQFLLSPDRQHYAQPGELTGRLVLGFVALTAAVAAMQAGAWRFISRQRVLAERRGPDHPATDATLARD